LEVVVLLLVVLVEVVYQVVFQLEELVVVQWVVLVVFVEFYELEDEVLVEVVEILHHFLVLVDLEDLQEAFLFHLNYHLDKLLAHL